MNIDERRPRTMNHDFICYIIISTIKIPHRLKNNFRYNYTVILYNNIIFRFSFQIRCSDEHTPRSGSEKIHFFLLQIPHWFLHSVFIFFTFFFFAIRNEHTRNGTTSPRRFIIVSYTSFTVACYNPHERKEISASVLWCKGTPFRVVRSYCFISVFFFPSSFCPLLKYFRIASTAGPPSSPFYLLYFLFPLWLYSATFIEILD